MRTLLLVSLTLALAGCAGDPATPTPTPATGASPTPTITPGGPEIKLHVPIANFSFAPPDATVAGGGLVSWMNHDAATHTVTAEDGRFNATLRAGETFRYDLPADAGVVRYRCTIHPSMTGILRTEEAPPTPTPAATPTPTPSPSPTPTPTAGATVTKASVAIFAFAFSPNPLKVAPGTNVTWTNNDAVGHTASANDGAFDSGTLPAGGSYSFTFTTPGTYAYKCKIHPTMTASVTVA